MLAQLTCEELMMNTKCNAKTIKKTFVSAIVTTLITLPLLASAADNNSGFFHVEKNLNNTTDQEVLYVKLQKASRKICGSTDLQRTGSVERVMANNECYEGTLTAAVERLNNPKIKELHELNS